MADACDEFGFQLWLTDGTPAGTRRAPLAYYAYQDIDTYKEAVSIGDTLYYITYGYFLNKTDGSPAESHYLASFQQGLSWLRTVNGTLFFQAGAEPEGLELWKSDGTPQGTVLVRDINPSGHSYPEDLADVDGTLYFNANDGVHGREPWVSDGTPAGTRLLKDIHPTGNSFAYGFTRYKGLIYFEALDPDHGWEMWRTDGTTSGTHLFIDIDPGPSSSAPNRYFVVNDLLLFTATTPTTGRELWRTDGTTTGTMIIKDVYPGTTGLDFYWYDSTESHFYFSGFTPQTGGNLWKSDGTTDGTVMVKDFPPGPTSASPYYITVVDDLVYFEADKRPFRSDGSAAGTFSINGARTGAVSFTGANGLCFFSAGHPDYGQEIWVTNGTGGGTHILKNICPDPTFSLAERVRRYLLGIDIDPEGLDVNNDGAIDIADALQAQISQTQAASGPSSL